MKTIKTISNQSLSFVADTKFPLRFAIAEAINVRKKFELKEVFLVYDCCLITIDSRTTEKSALQFYSIFKEKNDLQKVVKIAKFFNVDLSDVFAPSRGFREVCDCRGAVVLYMKYQLGFTHQEIGNYLGGRSHSTITTALKKARSLASVDKVYMQKLTACGLNGFLQ